MKLHVCMPLFEEMVFVNQSMYFAMLMYRSKVFFPETALVVYWRPLMAKNPVMDDYLGKPSYEECC